MSNNNGNNSIEDAVEKIVETVSGEAERLPMTQAMIIRRTARLAISSVIGIQPTEAEAASNGTGDPEQDGLAADTNGHELLETGITQ